MDINLFLQNVLSDLRIELKDEFDRNFEKKAFFDQAWKNPKFHNSRGSMMARTNNLRRSINAHVEADRIVFTSSLPYASIQNEGGEITVTAKMKRYFWAKFIEAGKRGIQADQWKAMALKKVGSKIKIESRRYIGPHPRIKEIVQEIVNENLTDLNKIIVTALQQKP